VWDFPRTVEKTVQWYRAVPDGKARAQELTVQQIDNYVDDARGLALPWAAK